MFTYAPSAVHFALESDRFWFVVLVDKLRLIGAREVKCAFTQQLLV